MLYTRPALFRTRALYLLLGILIGIAIGVTVSLIIVTKVLMIDVLMPGAGGPLSLLTL
jgi:hypothetical protein